MKVGPIAEGPVLPVLSQPTPADNSSTFNRIISAIKRVYFSVIEWIKSLFCRSGNKNPSYEQSGYAFADRSRHKYWCSRIQRGNGMPSLYRNLNRLGAELYPFIQFEAITDSVRIPLKGRVYFVCTSGCTQSQILRKKALDNGVPEEYLAPPHGIAYGYDSKFDRTLDNLNDYPIYRWNGKMLEELIKVSRFGENEKKIKMNVEQFEKAYWEPMIKEGGTLVIAGSSGHAALTQLYGTALKCGLRLGKVKVILLGIKNVYEDKDVTEDQKLNWHKMIETKIHFIHTK